MTRSYIWILFTAAALCAAALAGCGDDAVDGQATQADATADDVTAEDTSTSGDSDAAGTEDASADAEDTSADTADTSGAPLTPSIPPLDAPIDAPVSLPACETTLRPLVFAHGFLSSGDNFALQAQRLVANGHCPQALYAFDWDTLANDTPAAVAALDVFIDAALAEQGVNQVDLIGHSAGGGLGMAYLADPVRAAKVGRYAHVASNTEGLSAPDGVPTLSVTSAADLVVSTSAEVTGAQNLRLSDADHLQALTSAEAFEAVFMFLYGEAPARTDVPSTAQVHLSGRALALGTNVPLDQGRVFAYPLDPATGQRLSETPQAALATDALGYWGPFEATPGAPYELVVMGPKETRPVRYYLEPFTATSHLVYLRTFPKPPSLTGLLLRGLPFDDAQAIAVTFTANQAAISGRDVLTFEGVTLTSEALAPAEKSLIATFLFDENRNGTTEATAAEGAFAALPIFLAGLDVSLPADKARTLTATFQGRTLRAPAWPSKTEGAVVMIFR
jgi:pimeloyl-ACP methyl ester carboxylesterase